MLPREVYCFINKVFYVWRRGPLTERLPRNQSLYHKVLKILNEGCLVQLDGMDLPHGNINNGGVTQVLRDQLANVLNVEMEYLCSFDMMNQEFAMFGKYQYKVFPAEQKQEDVKPK
jgi:hypothetical protein